MNLISVLTLFTQIIIFLLIVSLIFRMSPVGLALRLIDLLLLRMRGAPMQHLSKITLQLYIGGQHRKRGWAQMQAMGITSVVNMREPQYDDRAIGIAPEYYLHLPTIDQTAPSLEDLCKGIQFIDTEIAQGRVVYVHCNSGIGRAPTMTIAYLMSKGKTLDEAFSTIKRVRPFIRLTKPQKKQLELFASKLQDDERMKQA
jgi:predicted protein tyrosine phosphatase